MKNDFLVRVIGRVVFPLYQRKDCRDYILFSKAVKHQFEQLVFFLGLSHLASLRPILIKYLKLRHINGSPG
jgi:hypothetical protein